MEPPSWVSGPRRPKPEGRSSGHRPHHRPRHSSATAHPRSPGNPGSGAEPPGSAAPTAPYGAGGRTPRRGEIDGWWEGRDRSAARRRAKLTSTKETSRPGKKIREPGPREPPGRAARYPPLNVATGLLRHRGSIGGGCPELETEHRRRLTSLPRSAPTPATGRHRTAGPPTGRWPGAGRPPRRNLVVVSTIGAIPTAEIIRRGWARRRANRPCQQSWRTRCLETIQQPTDPYPFEARSCFSVSALPPRRCPS